MSLLLEIQRCSEVDGQPSDAQLRVWASAALEPQTGSSELVIRIVDEPESQSLNRQYRGQDRPTNVLSFPFEMPAGMPVELAGELDGSLLGDLVICAPVVQREALEQKKPLQHHWAHMVVHGLLHLQGHDHQNEQEAQEMESLERTILDRLQIPDPYQTDGN